MSTRSSLKSQLVNFQVFRPFFPIGRLIVETVTFPLDYYLRGGRGRRLPSIINFNVTTRCNLNCEFCFNAENSIQRGEELDLAQIERLFNELGTERSGIFLSGGEPFVRKDLPDIVQLAKRRGCATGIVTNGLLPERETLASLVAAGNDVMIFSFHGMAQNHDRAVGLPGAFERSMNNLRTYGGELGGKGCMVNYIITEQSLDDLPAFIDLAQDLPIRTVRISHLNCLTHAEFDAQRRVLDKNFPGVESEVLAYCHSPNPDDFIDKLLDILERYGEKIVLKPILDQAEMRSWYSERFEIKRRCVFIWRSTFLNADGEVYPCQFIYLPMGNVRGQSMEQIWNNERYTAYRRLVKGGLMPGCARCCKL
ncbi:MAG: radical SAM protein [Candidatus Alcyoniella australis]|nr:radical SAM protein [Candidatus Alcyoniella australis]